MSMSVQNQKIDMLALLKEAGIAALIAAALALPLAGFKTFDLNGTLTVEPRFNHVLIAAVVVFFGRLLISIGQKTFLPPMGVAAGNTAGSIGQIINKNRNLLLILLLAAAIIFPFSPMANRHSLDLAVYVLIYVMLGWGLNIVVGLAGLLDLGYVAFYAVGAYSYALLATTYDLSFWICLPMAGIFAASFGIILGFPVLRLRGDYLAIVTLGFGEIIRVILLNWYQFTGGPDGIASIPKPTFFGLAEFSKRGKDGLPPFHELMGIEYSSLNKFIFFYFLIMVLALITNLFTLRIRKLPVGRAWEALREDETACRSLGINPTNTKLSAFAIGAMFAGFAGSFFATRQGFISPESFTFIESAIILAIVVLGGMGSQVGVVLASLLLVLGPEIFRELAEYRMLAFGGLMVLVMVWKPRGLLSNRAPTIRLHKEDHSEQGAAK